MLINSVMMVDQDWPALSTDHTRPCTSRTTLNRESVFYRFVIELFICVKWIVLLTFYYYLYYYYNLSSFPCNIHHQVALKKLGIHGQALGQTIKEISHIVERCSQWLWIRRKNPNNLVLHSKMGQSLV